MSVFSSETSSLAGTPTGTMTGKIGDPFALTIKERTRFESQFLSLGPNNGMVTGEQAKGFMLKSQLPPYVLGQIWQLADTDGDGKMNLHEFLIACKLINLKLRGHEIPKILPPSLVSTAKNLDGVGAPAPVTAPITAPVIPPLPQTIMPARPMPPKLPPQPAAITQANVLSGMMQPQMIATPSPLITSVPLITSTTQPALMQQQNANIIGATIMQPTLANNAYQPIVTASAPTVGQAAPFMPGMQPLIPGIAPASTIASAIPASAMIPGAGMPAVISQPSLAQPLVNLHAQKPLVSAFNDVAATNGSLPRAPSLTDDALTQGTTQPGIVPSAETIINTSLTSAASRRLSLEPSTQLEWAIPHPIKLKYTQLFNTTDRARTGFLSGQQARNLMVQSKLPNPTLAVIWKLADMDNDGRLGCEEFVLAMYLCEMATQGKPPPATLPPDLVPPSFRRASVASLTASVTSRHASISSQGAVAVDESAHPPLLSQTSFEDKRKENFEKGQAELERRRRALLEVQKAEAEARERKEREEMEKRERARAEQEKRRQEELQQQLREQMEKERQVEEERKRQQEQREAARKEMERQRQLEWEKQRLQELQMQRQRAQENVLRLKAKNQTLTIELGTLTDHVKELSQKICDTRVGVTGVKATIDSMRNTRDTHMQEMSQLKNKLKEQNARLIAISQEKAKMEARNKIAGVIDNETQTAYDNKEVVIKNLKEKLSDLEEQLTSKNADADNNEATLRDIQSQLDTLFKDCERMYADYEAKRDRVLEMRAKHKSIDYTNAWDTAVPVDNWSANEFNQKPTIAAGDTVKYRALYEFVARNNDEISFQPGDTIMVITSQMGEPGWLAGEIHGKVGWFPESYVEKCDGVAVVAAGGFDDAAFDDGFANRPLEGIAEVPETIGDVAPVQTIDVEFSNGLGDAQTNDAELFVALYPYQSLEPGDLSFNAGETIAVLKKDGDWWTGKIDDNVGIFPSNYVQKTETNGTTTTTTTKAETPVRVDDVTQQNQGIDAELSAINDKVRSRSIDKSPDFAAMSANTQTLKSGKKPEIASVIAPYQATSTEQLSLTRGQLIMIRKKSDTGWWEGELQAKGRRRQIGWFPATYVKVLESSGRNSGRNTPVSASKLDQHELVLEKVIALYPYTAQNVDELTFVKDDIISVTARDDPSWWRGELNGVSGLFPRNYVGPLTQSDDDTPHIYDFVDNTYETLDDYDDTRATTNKKRQEYIDELIQSERAYVDDMRAVNDVFVKPLAKSRVISRDDVARIFLNWTDILSCNERFLRDLEVRAADVTNGNGVEVVGDLLCRHLPNMTPYVQYCTNQLAAAQLLQQLTESQPQFKEFVKQCQCNPRTKAMPLSSFLLKPMQRITKYPLIVDKILAYTAHDHPDYLPLKDAHKKCEHFCHVINEGVRLTENYERLAWLQRNVVGDTFKVTFDSETNIMGPRRLLHFGILTKLKSGKELVCFLFNDFLLMTLACKPLPNGQFSFEKCDGVKFKVYKQPLLLNGLRLIQDADRTPREHLKLENINSIESNRILWIKEQAMLNNNMWTLYTPTANDCLLWTKRINEAISCYADAHDRQTKRKSKYAQPAALGRLLISVNYGARFQRITGKLVCDQVYCRLILADQEQVTSVASAMLGNISGNTQYTMNSSPLANVVFQWNAAMQFHLFDLERDVLEIEVMEKCRFTPDLYLGRAELRISDIYQQSQKQRAGPVIKKVNLRDVESGEVHLKVDVHLFK